MSWLFGGGRSDGDAVAAFASCVASGGIAVFPADTVYGVACDPLNRVAVERIYLLKRRPRDKAAAVMFFSLRAALEALPEVPPRTRELLRRLLPGAVTVLLPNPVRRFALACGDDLETLGLRVPILPGFERISQPVLQSSANRAGGRDPRQIAEVPELLRAGADVVIDGGELPGTPSTVLDLRAFARDGSWSVLREGVVAEAEIAAAIEGQFHFDPDTYGAMIREDIPIFEQLQEELAVASGTDARRVLELGMGTGETTRRLLARHPSATVVGVDASEQMLERAGQTLPVDRVQLHVGRLEDPLPEGNFDLVASALAIHHLTGEDKVQLFARIAAALDPGGRFVLADVIVPDDPADAVTALTPDFDRPSTVAEQLEWLADAGLQPRVTFSHRDLVVLVAEKSA